MSDIPADADPQETKLKSSESSEESEQEDQVHVPDIGEEEDE